MLPQQNSTPQPEQNRPAVCSQQWVRKETPPALGANEIHIWAVEMKTTVVRLEQDLLLLSPEELARANRYRTWERRKAYVTSRARLRILLHYYTGIAPRDLVFQYGSLGKPSLEGNSKDKRVCFNTSDSGNWALFAFALNNELGIDLETLPRPTNNQRLAKRVLTAGEQKQLFSVPAQRQQEAFLSLWTRKEAYGKALGTGIRYSLSQTELLRNSDLHGTRLRLHTISLPFNGICTLATNLESPSILGFLVRTADTGGN